MTYISSAKLSLTFPFPFPFSRIYFQCLGEAATYPNKGQLGFFWLSECICVLTVTSSTAIGIYYVQTFGLI